MSSDRNLLVGILAVQLNFVTKEQLVEAMNKWLLQKRTPLAELLPLDAESQQLLEALVKKHLAQHGNDPQQSLAALSSADAVKAALKGVHDADIQASIGYVSTGTVQQTHVHRSQDASLRFRILRPHARGGLGEVFVAQDTELNRNVALKEIQSRFADDGDKRGRFVMEAEVTAGLEHPNIVPVYGLGTYDDGRPFYAMRFIKGDSLKDAIENYHGTNWTSEVDKTLAFRNLLKRFVDVCNAMAYAHARGILHRDLKPGNIMLGKYGETLVVDWGLAKSLDFPQRERREADDEQPLNITSSGSYAETIHGTAIGTPAFMSPEQAAGKLDELSPATDVYSLGATLYVLLTGKVPFEGQIGDVLRKVEAGEFTPPRHINTTLAPALNAIVLKAMAKQPRERHRSTALLAEDVEHYLADEPVSGFAEPSSVRAKRWARKHPGTVAGFAASLIVGLLGTAAVLYFVNVEKNQTELARQNEAKQKTLAQQNEDQAKANEENATVARDVARKRYQLALDAFNDMVFSIQDKLVGKPGTLELRKDLLEKARKGLKKLVEEAEKQGSPDSTLVWSFFRLGDVELILGNVGLAEAEYRAGHAIAIRLAMDTKDAQAQNDLCVSYDRLGDVHLRLNQPAEALAAYGKCLAIREKLAAETKNDEAQSNLSDSYDNLGNVLLRMNQTTEALEVFGKSLSIRENLAADPKVAVAQRDLSTSYGHLGDVYLRLNKLTDAFAMYGKSLAIVEKLAEDPKNAQAQHDSSLYYIKLGEVHLRLNQPAEALAVFGKSLAIREKLAADPKDARAQRDLSINYNKLGDVYLRLHRSGEALAVYGKSLAIREKLAADPKDTQAQRDLCITYNKLGDVHLLLNQPIDALVACRRSQAIIEKLAADPKDTQSQRDLSVSYHKLGQVYLRLNEPAEALAVYVKCQSLREKLAVDPKDALSQRDLSMSYENLGDVYLRMNQLPEALAAYNKSLTIAEKLAADAMYTQAQRELAISFENIGNVHREMKDYTRAVEWYRKKLELSKKYDDNLDLDLTYTRKQIAFCEAALTGKK